MTIWCKICGGEIYPEIEAVNGTHASTDYCVVILNARVGNAERRAEAAEAELESALAVVDLYQQRMFAAEAEVAARAALKAQAAQWRPVTEPPDEHDHYLVYRSAPPAGEPWNYEFGVYDGDGGWDVGGVSHWMPLPAPPQEAE